MSFACHSYAIRMSNGCTHISLECYTCATQMSFVRRSYVLIYYLNVLICHIYVTCMYSYGIRMSLVCTRISLVCGYNMNGAKANG